MTTPTTVHPLSPDLERVLVLMVNPNLGNCVFALPTIDALCRHFSRGADVMVDEPYLPLLEMIPSAHRALAYPRAIKGRRRGLRAVNRYLGMAGHLLRRRYQAVLDIGGGITSVNVVALSMARHRVGFAGNRRSAVYSTRLDWGEQEHIFPRYGSILRGIGHADPPPQIELHAPAAAAASISEQLDRAFVDPGRCLAVIHPSAGYAFRCWPEERFAQVGTHLAGEKDMNIAVIGTPGDREVTTRIVEGIGCPGRVASLTPRLQELVALFERAALLVSNESGPTHLAATTRVPIVTLFGPSLESRWAPVRDRDITILRGAPCDPSCRWGVCVQDWACLRKTTVEHVLEAAETYLDR